MPKPSVNVVDAPFGWSSFIGFTIVDDPAAVSVTAPICKSVNTYCMENKALSKHTDIQIELILAEKVWKQSERC